MRDLRSCVEAHFRRIYEPSLGRLEDVREIAASPCGDRLALAGSIYDRCSGTARLRIGLFEIAAREMRIVEGDGNDYYPRWSPSGDLAFLSDRGGTRRFRLHVLNCENGRVQRLPVAIPGSAESFAWSPDGTRLAVCSVESQSRASRQNWQPHVESPSQRLQRALYCLRRAGGRAHRIGGCGDAVWNVAWCGNDGLIAVVSNDAEEGAWHEARLVHIALPQADFTTMYRPHYEIGAPAVTKDGRFVAVVEACASDRTMVAGDVLLFDRDDHWKSCIVDTQNVDVASLAVLGDREIAFAGVRDLEVVGGTIDVVTGRSQVAAATSQSWLRTHPALARTSAGYTTIAHGYAQPPRLVAFDESGSSAVLHDFSHAGSDYVLQTSGVCTRLEWEARDGLSVHGYLARPPGVEKAPLVTIVHGGPQFAYTNAWPLAQQITGLLVSRGYAVLLPNPRGSTGRGQAFARMVRGDVGGEEAHDTLSGVAAVIRSGIADPERLAIMGGSHGGFMAAWLVTQASIFAAAVCAFPVTDWFSMQFTSHNPQADTLLLQADPFDLGGAFFTRSPLHFARNVRTPVLCIAGGSDPECGPEQARMFYRALTQNGAVAELAIYPQEGHGISRFEAYVDYCARILAWFETHLQRRST